MDGIFVFGTLLISDFKEIWDAQSELKFLQGNDKFVEKTLTERKILNKKKLLTQLQGTTEKTTFFSNIKKQIFEYILWSIIPLMLIYMYYSTPIYVFPSKYTAEYGIISEPSGQFKIISYENNDLSTPNLTESILLSLPFLSIFGWPNGVVGIIAWITISKVIISIFFPFIS